MEKSFYLIDSDKLRELLYCAAMLECLESNGVDNWIGYMDNRESFISSYLGVSEEKVEEDNLQIQDVADNWLEEYTPYNSLSELIMDKIGSDNLDYIRLELDRIYENIKEGILN